MKSDPLDRLTAAFREVFGQAAPASQQAVTAALDAKRDTHGDSVNALSALLAELPFDAIQNHLAGQGFEVGALPLLARSGGGVGRISGGQAPASSQATELEDALRGMSATGDGSVVRAMLEGWGAHVLHDPVTQTVRNGSKVTLEVE